MQTYKNEVRNYPYFCYLAVIFTLPPFTPEISTAYRVIFARPYYVPLNPW